MKRVYRQKHENWTGIGQGACRMSQHVAQEIYLLRQNCRPNKQQSQTSRNFGCWQFYPSRQIPFGISLPSALSSISQNSEGISRSTTWEVLGGSFNCGCICICTKLWLSSYQRWSSHQRVFLKKKKLSLADAHHSVKQPS